MDLKKLIGRKVRVTKSESVFQGRTMVSYSLDDPTFKKEVEDLFESVRFKLPGRVYTMDYRPTRANVIISEEGIVTGVNFG